jgi:type IV pilus assembly protein PilY1
MKYSMNILIKRLLQLACLLVLSLGLLNPLLAASVSAPVDLATSPLATSTTTTVKPNLLFILDDSGSMDRDYMPDDFTFGSYGESSSQCNQVYYDPSNTYLPPLDATGTLYPDASFTGAWVNGFRTSAGTTNLNNLPAFYFAYSGTQDTPQEKNYQNPSNTFAKECASNIGSSPGNAVFSKRRLASTSTATIVVSGSDSTSVSSIKVNGVELLSGATAASTTSSTVATNIKNKITLSGFSATVSNSTVTITGPATASNFTPVITKSGSMNMTTEAFSDSNPATLTNFANWYSYYRTRLLMMKTASGRAFSTLNNKYRVGLMMINDAQPAVEMDTFEGAHRSSWYTKLYSVSTNGGTPLRESLSKAGKFYAGTLGTDPVQYSCQQNFSILSTDGYWNGNEGFKLDGTAVGNQDSTAGRPMYDGAQAATTVTTQYTRDYYTSSRSNCNSGRRLTTQPQIRSCSVTAGVETCGLPQNNGSATTGPCSGSVPRNPSPTGWVAQGTPVTTPGSTGGSSDSLADVAMYYYNTDLRSGSCALCIDNVFTSGLDNNKKQHMTTFTLGLGASGKMNYSSAYLSGGSDDFNAVTLGSTASSSVCTWQASGTVCNWPLPGSNNIENIDDLWHAAVNGRGAYFSATNPESLSAGLANALAAINARKGAAAAAATSTLNPVANNNFAYVASYSTVSWKGNLEAREVNVNNGEVSENALWCVENVAASSCAAPSTVEAETTSGDTTIYNCVTPNSTICSNGTLVGTDCKVPVAVSCSGTMSSLVDSASDTRKIWTKGAGASTLNNFKLGAGNALSATDFDDTKLSGLSQWVTPPPNGLDATQKAAAVGDGIVNYLRGQKGKENSTNNAAADRLFRAREATLGDAVESQPAYIGPPTFSYVDTGYSDFKTANASRPGTIYIGANDGMMHAFNSENGIERWAYVPSMVIPNLWKLADFTYAANHRYFVNGSPIVSDINVGGTWKTILVAGLNGGGRGYYALDITDPAAPELLWEFTPANDGDLGYTFGNPVITKKADGTWVVLVTSGYNNIPEPTNTPVINSGDGKGYLYVLDAGTGSTISKIGTGVGSTSVPSGLAQISTYADKPELDNKAVFTYGGDLLGNVWRFDIDAETVVKFAELKDAGGLGQPITTKPELGNVLTSDGKIRRVVFIGTGKYLETDDLTDTQGQTLYAIKDDDTQTSPATATLVNPRASTASPNRMVQQTITGGTDNRTVTTVTSTNKTDFKVDRGWFVDFPDSGERENVAMQLVLGTLIVPTTVPSSTVCEPGGRGWLNYFNYLTGGPVGNANIVSTSMTAPIVGINVMYIVDPGTGKLVPKVSTVGANDPTPKLIPGTPFSSTGSGFQKKRAIWRELVQ